MTYNDGSYLSDAFYGTGLPPVNTDLSQYSFKPVDLYLNQGDTYTKVITIYDNLGQPFNLTGYDVGFVVRQWDGAGTIYTPTASVSDTVNGKITVSVDQTTSSLLTHPRYNYSIRVTDYTKYVTVQYGQILITQTT
jgi:hypothetical protein